MRGTLPHLSLQYREEGLIYDSGCRRRPYLRPSTINNDNQGLLSLQTAGVGKDLLLLLLLHICMQVCHEYVGACRGQKKRVLGPWERPCVGARKQRRAPGREEGAPNRPAISQAWRKDLKTRNKGASLRLLCEAAGQTEKDGGCLSWAGIRRPFSLELRWHS